MDETLEQIKTLCALKQVRITLEFADEEIAEAVEQRLDSRPEPLKNMPGGITDVCREGLELSAVCKTQAALTRLFEYYTEVKLNIYNRRFTNK